MMSKMSNKKIDKIVNRSCLPIKIKTKLKALKKINYYFLFKNEYMTHSNDPLVIIKMIELCQRNKVIPLDYDIFIEEDNIKNIIKNNSYKSWEIYNTMEKHSISMDIALQGYLRRKEGKDLAKFF